MPDDSSLTDFFDDDEGKGSGDEATAEPGDTEVTAESGDTEETIEPDADAVAPADVTYEWSDDETACADCGDPTRRRWRDARDGEAVFVCAECKDW